MDTEIELKFFIYQTDIIDQIPRILTQAQLEFTQSQQQLRNCYYDTVDYQLRKLDMGLRVRTVNGRSHQTIKTRGQVLSGLHQRPEYNIDLESNSPILNLFPAKIWPENTDLEQLQAELTPLFFTDFCRTIWTVCINESTIELAYDHGAITAGKHSTPINEIELELLKGSKRDLFSLAEILTELKFIPGIHSKAARGYQLIKPQPLTIDVNVLEQITLSPSMSLPQTFHQGIEFALSKMQLYVTEYIQQPKLRLLIKITEMLALMRHGFWLFADFLPSEIVPLRDQLSHFIKQLSWVDNARHLKEITDKTGNYRKKLEYSEQLVEQLKFERNEFPDAASVSQIFCSQAFNNMQLSLLQMLLKESLLNDKAAKISLHDFAVAQLDNYLQALKQVMGQPIEEYATISEIAYLKHYKLLLRSLLTGSWFGSLYQSEERDDFRHPWLDLKQGIAELQSFALIEQHLESVEFTPEKLSRWLQAKVENLLIALEHSRATACQLAPYWR